MALINVAAVKKIALEFSKVHRGGKFTRVSKGFSEQIDAQVRNIILARVKAHPSKGKTLE